MTRRGDRSRAGRGRGRRPRRWPRAVCACASSTRCFERPAGARGGATRIRWRWCRSARELRARRIAVVALEEPERRGPADGGGPGGARARRAAARSRGRSTSRCRSALYRQVRAVVEGAVLGGYRRGSLEERRAAGAASTASSSAARRTSCATVAARAELVARWTNVARELVDGPPNVVTPAGLAERAAALPGLRVEVLDPVAAGLPALAAVGGSSAHAPQLIVLRHEPAGRAGAAAARARRQGRHLRRRRLLPQAAVGHRAPEGRHGRRRGGARRARRDRRARAAARRARRPPRLREHDRARRDPAVGRDHDRRRPHRRGDEPGRRGPADPRRRALVRARRRARRTSSTSRR